MSDADLLDDLIARLFLLREEMGSGAYREACLKAAVAVARVALLEAEERATGVVLPFRPVRRVREIEHSGTDAGNSRDKTKDNDDEK